MIKLLDHGYIAYVEHWGSDERIIEAARMSTGKGFQGWGQGPCLLCQEAGRLDPRDKLYIDYEKMAYAMDNCPHCKGTGKAVGDEKLLKYLYDNKHATPFEMGGLVIEVQAPIFVFREWHRHRTQSYNEMSARYTSLPNVNYVPSVERLMQVAGSNKQAAGTGAQLTAIKAAAFQSSLHRMYAEQEELYQCALADGVPKELARVHLPVARYSRMRASANLRNWLQFLTLRQAPNAQWEIRQYADAVNKILVEHFPRTMELFNGPEHPGI